MTDCQAKRLQARLLVQSRRERGGYVYILVVVAAVLGVLLVMLVGMAAIMFPSWLKFRRQVTQVKIGMTKEQVRTVMAGPFETPVKVYTTEKHGAGPFKEEGYTSDGHALTHEVWVYFETWGTCAYVFFDEAERVEHVGFGGT